MNHQMLTMLLPMIISLLMIIFTSILHYKKHFKVHTPSSTPRKTSINRRKTIVNKKRHECCCWIGSIDNQNYDFFPSSFYFYAIFTMFLCIVLITKFILTNHISNFTYIQTIDSIYYYILIYGVIIVSVWESFFSFCRYWITKIAKDQCRVASTVYCLKRFILYIIAYFTLWTLHTHVIQNLFSATIIVTFHCTFNIYCISMNASILIKQYESISTTDSSRNLSLFNITNEIINAIYFMKHASIVSNIISTIYLSVFLFIITYNNYTNITYYLSILWAISCFIFSLNFVKNRKYIQHKLLQLWQFIRCKDNNKTSETSNKKIVVKIDVDPSEITENKINYKELMVDTPGITPGIDTNIQNNVYANIVKHNKNPTYMNKKLETPKIGATLSPVLGLSHSVSCDAYKFENPSIENNNCFQSALSLKNNKSSSKNKSLKQSIIESTNNLTLKLGLATKSESIYVNMDKDDSNSSDGGENGKEKEDITCVYNEMITPQPIEQTEQLKYHNAMTETPQVSLNVGLSLPALPMVPMAKSASVPSATGKKFHLKLPQTVGLNHKNTKSMEVEHQSERKSWHAHSHGNLSMNFVNKINLDQVFLSLNTLASHGFCSPNSIHSAQQIKLHQIKLSQQIELLKLEAMNENNKSDNKNEMPKLSLTTSTM